MKTDAEIVAKIKAEITRLTKLEATLSDKAAACEQRENRDSYVAQRNRARIECMVLEEMIR